MAVDLGKLYRWGETVQERGTTVIIFRERGDEGVGGHVENSYLTGELKENQMASSAGK